MRRLLGRLWRSGRRKAGVYTISLGKVVEREEGEGEHTPERARELACSIVVFAGRWGVALKGRERLAES